MAKRIVVRKDVLENVWDSFIEKAIRSHKYIRKIPNSKGGFYYVYPSDFKKPIKALLSIFGMKEEQIDNAYKNNEIKQAYGASKEVFASHLMEYLTNRATWNKFFSDKFNRDKYKTPVKFEPKKSELKEKVQNGEIKNNGKVTDKTGKEHNETKEKDFKSKWNNSLMRKIYSMYNPIPEDKKVENSENRVSGESVSFNGKVGKITKDFGNDYVFVQFDGGGMGRFKKTDLQNLNPTNQEVVNESDINGDEIKENDSSLNTTNVVNQDFANETDAEKTQEEKDREWHEKWDIRLADEFVKGKEKYLNAKPLVSNNAFIMFDKVWDSLKDKTRNEQIKGLYNMVKDDYQMSWNESLAYRKEGYSKEEVRFGYINAFLETKNPAEEHENRSQAMMGNDNAKKYGLTDDDVSIVKRLVDKYNFTKEQFASSAARTGNIKSINDYAKEHGMKAYDVALDVYDIIINNKTEAVDEMITERDTSALSQAMMGNQNARKYGNLSEESNNNSALENYASGDGMWVNNYLRNPSLYESESGVLNETDKQFIADLDNATTTEIITDKKLYRAVDASAVFGNISDLDFENLQTSVVYGNKEKLYADKVDSLIDGAINKEITEKGFMSTTKDENIAANWDGFTGSNKEVVMELNIPDGLTGKDMKDFDVEGDEQKEVLLPRNLDYKVTEITKGKNGKILVKADVLGVHGNHIAMLGNQNARKQGYTDEVIDIEQKNNGQENPNRFNGGAELNQTSTSNENNITETENINTDTSKLSEAMLGNDNAKGKHNVKPQTESEMKKEQKKEKEARKKAGLPNPGNNVGDRVSAIDDADTWNPNSENYRFKDTGYIAGSRKEMASMFIMERAKNGTRIDAHEIDFDGLEENPRAAEKLITKSNIFGEVDWDGLREKGMSGSTAFLIDRIYASAGSKPDESNAQARKQYVIALNGLRDRFEDCKTVPEVIDTLKEIREEIRGEYVEIKEMPEYKKITDKMKSLNEIMRNKRNELMGLSEQGSKTYNVERQKIIEKYIQKGKDEKKLRWNTRVSEYNIPKEYQEEYKKETKGLWDKAYEPWKKAVEDFKAELISRGVKEEDFFTGKKNMAGKPIEVSWYDYYTLMPEAQEYGALSSELDAYIKKMKVAVSMKNPLLEAWKSLGKRFTDILYSDSFNQHKYECTKGTYDNWEWLEKEVKVTEKKTGKEKKRFQLKVANSITRKGGRDFNLTTTQDLKKAFNLREVQSGNWVLKDPTSAEFHVRNASNAFADLADVTGIGDDKISLNGRLAMAFGARGTGNAGGTTAMAHYEPVERVINLTKFKGGGCLGHEWFHAFDNMITSAMTGDNSIADVYLTNMYHGMTEANKLLLEEYVNLKDADSTYSNVYRKNQLKKQLEKKGVDVSEIDKSHKSALQIKVQNAFDDVVKAMTEGTEELMTTLTYEHKDYVNMISNMSDNVLQRYRDYYSSYSGDRKPMQLLIADAGSLDDAVRAINKRYEKYNDSKSIKNKRDWLKISAAYYDRKPDGTKGLQPLIIPSGKTGSQFLADAKDLDNQDGRAYWSETHEMAARAFSSYIEDTLQSMGRQNDYLAYASDNKYYGGDKPYPEGEERKRINAAFKKLFEVINSEQAIQKSIDILDNFIEKSEPRFIIKDGRFLVRK